MISNHIFLYFFLTKASRYFMEVPQSIKNKEKGKVERMMKKKIFTDESACLIDPYTLDSFFLFLYILSTRPWFHSMVRSRMRWELSYYVTTNSDRDNFKWLLWAHQKELEETACNVFLKAIKTDFFIRKLLLSLE